MIDIDALEALANAAGAGEWTASDRIVWFGDGDSAMQVMNPVPVFVTHDNLGQWPDPIAAEDVAQFAAAANPAAILALIAEVRALRKFHDFYSDRCEGLFAQFGMAAIDAYIEAARSRREA